jgi:hypothetical protein
LDFAFSFFHGIIFAILFPSLLSLFYNR